MNHRLPIAGVVEAVIDGVTAGSRDLDIDIRLIGILSRTFGTEACQQELDGLLAHRDRIVALDLAGDELGYPCELFHRTSGRPVTPAGALPCTPEKPPVLKVSGRPSTSWKPSGSATALPRLSIPD